MANSSGEEAELMVQSEKLYICCLLTNDLDDIEQAVRGAQEVFDLMPQDCLSMPIIRYNLARPLVRRFLYTRNVEDITKAIEMFRQASQLPIEIFLRASRGQLSIEAIQAYASQLLTDNNPMRDKCLKYLTFSKMVQDAHLDADLVGSLELNDLHVRIWRGSRSSGGPSLKIKIESLHRSLGEDDEVFAYYRSQVDARKESSVTQASLKDLDSEIQLARQALEFFSPPPSDPLKISRILVLLGCHLNRRYTLQSVRGDNNEAVDCFCRALELPMTTRVFGYCLIFASEAFIRRFEALGRREDLDSAVNHAKQAMEKIDSRDDIFATCLDKLARVMNGRYTITGEMNDLDAAIDASLRAANIAEHHDFAGELPRLLCNLAVYLEVRYERTGQSEDLRHAIEIAQRVVDLWPPKDPRRVQCLVNLSALEYTLGDNLQNGEYVERAVRHLEQAWSIGEEDLGLNPGLDLCLYNHMGRFLSRVYSRWNRWDMATNITGIIDTNPDYTFHPLAGQSRSNHFESVFNKWKSTQQRDDLDEAIIIARRMIELSESRAKESSMARGALGDCLYHRYKSTGDDEDLKDALAVLLEGFRNSASPPCHRIMAGQSAIDILSEMADWGNARKLSREIVGLIVILNGRSLEWQDKQFWLQQFSYKAPIYASIALQAGSDEFDVIDMLETCRGSILGHLIDNRTDLDDLKKVAPKEAERFRTLRDEVNAVIDPSGDTNTRVKQITRRGEAEGEIRACLENIRKLEGFDRFLLGPTEREVKAVAAEGPILIVNVTSIRSDAIIITENASVLLPLPKLKYEKVKEYQELGPINFNNLIELGKKNKKYIGLLKWLWDNCVKLIFQKLDDLVPGRAKFHVWWIGIGIAGSLPFHAAGIYTGNVRETALSRAISSYTPTLKILIHGRRKLKNDRPKPDVQQMPSKPEILIITMPSTAGKPELDLKGVQDEAERIQKIIRGVYSPQPSLQPNAKDTKEHMEKCEIVHFACHGQLILTDPSSSHLLLQAKDQDSGMLTIDELKVRDVATLNLSHGKLAFLSACSTAENRLRTLWDEALHLASGFQVAGYLHTIGNLWPANDEVSVQIVEGFYQYLVEAGELGHGQNVAKSLNEALIDVSEKHARQPLAWAQYVHFGV